MLTPVLTPRSWSIPLRVLSPRTTLAHTSRRTDSISEAQLTCLTSAASVKATVRFGSETAQKPRLARSLLVC
ncbi:hypothetical protein FRX31_027834 [Thalictrum thalictroides]|uniref:Uncharacterized protein n=1 Tax=Thalictrum thalictroides TaxID=46969 RepID=A0A7J6VD97_THATH|nr:hypothetical protein FRX31_027834 [Thalictrum thalictroides]